MKTKTCRAMIAAVLISWCAMPAFAQTTTSQSGKADVSAKTETPQQRDARMKWWREARFGMFVHWSASTQTGGKWKGKLLGDPIFNMMAGKISIKDYKAFTADFNPTRFDANSLVSMANETGMKYIVLISKHHDGFAMWGSKASDFNIVDHTPYKRDVVAEVATACKKQNMKFGIYYSQCIDWTHPGGAIWDPNLAAGAEVPWDEAQKKGSFNEYVRTVAVPQVRELANNYGPLAVFWWDIPIKMGTEQSTALRNALANQPQIITNNRLAPGVPGDFETPEQNIPAKGLGRDWETCQTINGSWTFYPEDTKWKSSQKLIRELVDTVSKGGNYLLNVSPTAEGLIPQPEIDRMHDIGGWMKINGEAIYGTKASPFEQQLSWGRCTQKPGKLYLHVFDWPKDGKLIVPLQNKIVRANLLSDPKQKLKVVAVKNGVEIQVPTFAPDSNASVVMLKIIGSPRPLK